jgi:hypothetical protein
MVQTRTRARRALCTCTNAPVVTRAAKARLLRSRCVVPFVPFVPPSRARASARVGHIRATGRTMGRSPSVRFPGHGPRLRLPRHDGSSGFVGSFREMESRVHYHYWATETVSVTMGRVMWI